MDNRWIEQTSLFVIESCGRRPLYLLNPFTKIRLIRRPGKADIEAEIRIRPAAIALEGVIIPDVEQHVGIAASYGDQKPDFRRYAPIPAIFLERKNADVQALFDIETGA